ncbi:RNA polymerase sigma factor ShbA [Actinomycetospora chiangmaiensis]|uniref:RNA polymerase sigma factor ShbA n=1 Tax=Actinomycetospora chiangmaiensis TaxID=402650 RepID=UPI00037D1A4C|nr:RNA polymerase sigma factor ShbA [Actinomycetospora chiangmaiensis]
MRAEPSAARLFSGVAPHDEGPDARLDGLVDRARTGDRGALEQVLRVVRPLVVRYCRSRLGRTATSAGEADDVAQEVCLAVLRALPDYRDQGRPFLAFVFGIATHKVADAHRGTARRPVPVEVTHDRADPDDGPETLAVRRAGEPGLLRVVAALPARQREVLHLRVVLGLSAEETAAAIGSTAGAVRVAQHRALATLRRSFPNGPADAGPTGDAELDALVVDADTALGDLVDG